MNEHQHGSTRVPVLPRAEYTTGPRSVNTPLTGLGTSDNPRSEGWRHRDAMGRETWHFRLLGAATIVCALLLTAACRVPANESNSVSAVVVQVRSEQTGQVEWKCLEIYEFAAIWTPDANGRCYREAK